MRVQASRQLISADFAVACGAHPNSSCRQNDPQRGKFAKRSHVWKPSGALGRQHESAPVRVFAGGGPTVIDTTDHTVHDDRMEGGKGLDLLLSNHSVRTNGIATWMYR